MKTVVIILVALVWALPVMGQGFIATFSTVDPSTQEFAILDNICGGTTHPIADHTIVEVWWDRDPAGPSANDTLAPLCDHHPDCDGGFGTLSYNSFEFNGDLNDGVPGTFLSTTIGAYGQNPSPSRYYLKICLPPVDGSPHRYISRSVTFTPGQVADIQFGLGDWTCVDSGCGGCPSPTEVLSVNASDSTTCTGVVVNWVWNGADTVDVATRVDSFIILRDQVQIGEVPRAIRTFTDINAQPNSRPQYTVRSHNACGRSSAGVDNYGSIYPSPQTPIMDSASTVQCDSVIVRWHYTAASGIDSFFIYRGATKVGAILAAGSPGLRRFAHATTSPDYAPYQVFTWNHVCGLPGMASTIDSGRALQDPTTMDFAVTYGGCDSTVVTWTAIPGATSYRVYRSNVGGGGEVNWQVFPPNTRYSDITGLSGTNYEYWVIATNLCGTGPAPSHRTGLRNTRPAAPALISATDSLYCDSVVVTWADLSNETSFRVYRRLATGGTIDSFTVAADIVRYRDTSALAGILYNYWVRGIGACGRGDSTAANSGSRKAPPGQVLNVLATESTDPTFACTGVRVTWSDIASEDSFIVLRNAARLAAVAANVVSYLDTSAVRGTVYSYTVQAKNTCNTGTVSAADNGSRRRLPGTASGLTASQDSCTAVYLNWATLTNTDSFQIYRAPGTYLKTVAVTTLTYADTSAPSGNSSYYIVPLNACGAGTQSTTVQGRRLPPLDAVTGIAATTTNCNAVHITWNTMTADSFQIRRDGGRIAAVTSGTSYDDATGNADTGHWYTVVAYNRCGSGGAATPVYGRKGSDAVIALLAPNGGDQWQVMTTETILWSDCNGGKVKIELNRNYPAGVWEVLRDSTENDGTEAVYVTDPLSTHCRIRISAVGDTLSDLSDADFSIVSSQGYLGLARSSAPGTAVLNWAAGVAECPQVQSEWFRVKNFGSEAIVVFQPMEPASPEFSRTTSCGGFFALAPGQLSACSLRVSFDAAADGSYADTLLLQSDAVNAVNGFVRIPLAGSQISTPAVPQITILPQGMDVHLSWQPITQSVGGCPVVITYYLVFYAPTAGGPFYYHGYTGGTSYVHGGVIAFAAGMYYQVVAYAGSPLALSALPAGERLTQTEVLQRLGQP